MFIVLFYNPLYFCEISNNVPYTPLNFSNLSFLFYLPLTVQQASFTLLMFSNNIFLVLLICPLIYFPNSSSLSEKQHHILKIRRLKQKKPSLI